MIKSLSKQLVILEITDNQLKVNTYRSLENFQMKLFRCEKISCEKFSWLA